MINCYGEFFNVSPGTKFISIQIFVSVGHSLEIHVIPIKLQNFKLTWFEPVKSNRFLNGIASWKNYILTWADKKRYMIIFSRQSTVLPLSNSKPAPEAELNFSRYVTKCLENFIKISRGVYPCFWYTFDNQTFTRLASPSQSTRKALFANRLRPNSLTQKLLFNQNIHRHDYVA